MKLDEELDRIIGDGPEHRPLAETIAAGQRTVRRRRGLGTGAAAAAAVVVIGGVWSLTGGGADDPGSQAPFAGDPTASTDDDQAPSTPSLGFSGADCALVGDGIEIVAQIDDPYGRAGRGCERAIAYDDDGTELWILAASPTGGRDEPARDLVGPVPAVSGQSFQDWVAEQGPDDAGPFKLPSTFPAPVTGLIGFADGDGETLVAIAPGAEVVEQTGDVDLADYAAPGDRTAAAQVTLDGSTYFVLARDLGGTSDFIVDVSRTDDETIAGFLQRASDLYDSGEGLL